MDGTGRTGGTRGCGGTPIGQGEGEGEGGHWTVVGDGELIDAVVSGRRNTNQFELQLLPRTKSPHRLQLPDGGAVTGSPLISKVVVDKQEWLVLFRPLSDPRSNVLLREDRMRVDLRRHKTQVAANGGGFCSSLDKLSSALTLNRSQL